MHLVSRVIAWFVKFCAGRKAQWWCHFMLLLLKNCGLEPIFLLLFFLLFFVCVWRMYLAPWTVNFAKMFNKCIRRWLILQKHVWCLPASMISSSIFYASILIWLSLSGVFQKNMSHVTTMAGWLMCLCQLS